MKTTIQNPVTKGNVTVRYNMEGTEKGVNQKTTQEAKKFKVKNKSNYLSIKQTMAIQSLAEKVEKGGNINLGEILIEVGYSKNTAKTPQKVFGKEIVREHLKKIGLDPAGIRRAHEYLMNAKKLIKITASLDYTPESVISVYEKEFFWVCIAYYPDEKKGIMVYEMAVPNDKCIIKALELAYRYLPYHDIQSEKTRNSDITHSSKALEKIRALTEAKRFHTKNPLI